MKVKVKAKAKAAPKAKKEKLHIYNNRQLTICIHSLAKVLGVQHEELDVLFLKVSQIEEKLAHNGKTKRKANA